MPQLRFAHLADLHLDTPFHGIGAVDPAIQASLAEASLQAWDRAVDLCLQQRLDFVLIAGDVYDQEEAGVRAQLRFLRGLQRLSTAGLPVFVIHGNHDPQGGRWPAIKEWPAGVTVFGHRAVELVPVQRDGQVVALVHGISYPVRHVTENLALRFHRRDEPVYQIGLLHASVGDHPEHGRYAPCSLEDLRHSGLDYWALGHVHTRQTLSPQAPAAVYPGNLQARHPGEQGPRGFYLVEVEPGQAPQLTFQPCDLWRFATLTIDLAQEPLDSVDQVAAHLVRSAQDRRADRGLIARAELVGATPLHADLNRPGVRAELLRELRDQAPAAGDLWWDDLTLDTRPTQDRSERMAAADFVGDLLRWSETHRGEAPARVAAILAELRGNADLTAVRQEVDWSALESDADDLSQQAEQLAWDLLEERADR